MRVRGTTLGICDKKAALPQSWIPSEAVTGASRLAFDSGFTHYDEPPPAELGDVEELRAADRFRFANVLRAWVEVGDDGADQRRRLQPAPA